MKRELQTSFQKTLEDAAAQRKDRHEIITLGNGRTEVAWVIFERDTMFDAVTRERAKLGKGPVAMTEVQRVETMACGHSDYGRKFALYCAELVLDIP